MYSGSKFKTFTRLGFVARGILYITIAALVTLTEGDGDNGGALQFLAGGVGRWMLMLMAAGFLFYGLWRLSDAALNIEGHGDGKRGMGERAGAAVSGIAHLFLAWQSISLAAGARGTSGDGARQSAETALELPGGQLLLGIAALVLIVAGIVQLARAVSCSFLQQLDPKAQESWVKWLGRAGYSARGVIFLIAGYFLAQAALDSQASEAGGISEALSWLSGPVEVLVASGLFLFGVYSIVEARYRRVHRPPVEAVAARASAEIGGG